MVGRKTRFTIEVRKLDGPNRVFSASMRRTGLVEASRVAANVPDSTLVKRKVRLPQ